MSPAAAKEWLSLLEGGFLIKLLPYSAIRTACPLRPQTRRAVIPRTRPQVPDRTTPDRNPNSANSSTAAADHDNLEQCAIISISAVGWGLCCSAKGHCELDSFVALDTTDDVEEITCVWVAVRS